MPLVVWSERCTGSFILYLPFICDRLAVAWQITWNTSRMTNLWQILSLIIRLIQDFRPGVRLSPFFIETMHVITPFNNNQTNRNIPFLSFGVISRPPFKPSSHWKTIKVFRSLYCSRCTTCCLVIWGLAVGLVFWSTHHNIFHLERFVWKQCGGTDCSHACWCCSWHTCSQNSLLRLNPLTSLEAIYLMLHTFLWSHKRLPATFYFTNVMALPNKQCKISGIPLLMLSPYDVQCQRFM